MASEVTDLPEPDSPTKPSTSPLRMANDTSRTAITRSPGVGKLTVRLRISSSRSTYFLNSTITSPQKKRSGGNLSSTWSAS
jgi:hypothetical protein